MSINAERALKSRQRLKERLVRIFGGACNVCGYNKTIKALEFHHIDPSTKTFGIGHGHTRSFKDVVEESKKCIMLCANCHREVHDGLLDISVSDSLFDVVLAKTIIEEIEKARTRHYDSCPVCGNKKPTTQTFCSSECSQQYQSDKPKKLLVDDLVLIDQYEKHQNFEAVGRLHNVTGAAVKRRLKKIQHI